MSDPAADGLNTLAVGTGGPRVAFLHGLFGQGRNWTQIAKTLAGPDGDSARCLLVDLPDHGRSPWSQEFSFEGYADAVAATARARVRVVASRLWRTTSAYEDVHGTRPMLAPARFATTSAPPSSTARAGCRASSSRVPWRP